MNGSCWVQDLSVPGSYPRLKQPNEGDTYRVYKGGDGVYHNHTGGTTETSCKHCQIPEWTSGSYQIQNQAQLKWFLEHYSSEKNAGQIAQDFTVDSTWATVTAPFSGTLAGKHTVTISGGPLFAEIAQGGSVRELTAAGSGKLATANKGTIEGVTNIGSGALVGSNSGKITGCANTGAGKLCQTNAADGILEKCRAESGALVQENRGVIHGSYTTGGALCGTNSGTVANCYVSGSGGTLPASGTVENCYYLSASQTASGGRTAAQFKAGQVAYELMNGVKSSPYPADTWGQTLPDETLPTWAGKPVFYSDRNTPNYHNHNGYCESCYDADKPQTGTVDGQEYYLITTAQELAWFAMQVNEQEQWGINARLEKDIVYNTGVLVNGELTSNASALAPWTPIELYGGIFDGGGHSISGLYVIAGNSAGLFSDCTGTIKNLTIQDSYIQGDSCVGALVGQLRGGSITNCHNAGSVVKGSTAVGGIVGDAKATVTGCTSSGSVTGKTRTGGIAGAAAATVTGCTNSGSVTGSEEYTGGICGYYNGNNAAVSKCMNSGSVTGSSKNVGGVVGRLNSGSVTSCGNTGSVARTTDSGTAGGILGSMYSGTVQYCYTVGTVTGYSGNYPLGQCRH